MIGPTFWITIPEKPCDINQTQKDWHHQAHLKLPVSRSHIYHSGPCLGFLTVSKTWNCLEKVSTSSQEKFEDHAHSLHATLSLTFILSNIKISIFSTMVPSKITNFSNMTTLLVLGIKSISLHVEGWPTSTRSQKPNADPDPHTPYRNVYLFSLPYITKIANSWWKKQISAELKGSKGISRD